MLQKIKSFAHYDTLITNLVIVSIFVVIGACTYVVKVVAPSVNKKKIYQVSNGAICKLWASESCGLTLSGCDDGATYRCATNTIEIEAGK